MSTEMKVLVVALLSFAVGGIGYAVAWPGAPWFLALGAVIVASTIAELLALTGHVTRTAAFVFEALIVGWITLQFAAFQLDHYHPIKTSLPPTMCDAFGIEAAGMPSDYVAPPGLCTEEFVKSALAMNFPAFGDGKDWPGTLMAAVEDDFRKGDTELPRLQREKHSYSATKEAWLYGRLNEPSKFETWQVIYVIAVIMTILAMIFRLPPWLAGLVTIWAAFQIVFGFLGVYPESELQILRDLYRDGMFFAVSVVILVPVIRGISFMVSMGTSIAVSGADRIHYRIGDVLGYLGNIALLLVGGFQIFSNSTIAFVSWVDPALKMAVLNSHQISPTDANTAFVMGFFVVNGIILAIIAWMPEYLTAFLFGGGGGGEEEE